VLVVQKEHNTHRSITTLPVVLARSGWGCADFHAFSELRLGKILLRTHDPHRLSQSVLRIALHSVPFRGSAIVPTILSFLSRAPKRCLPVCTRALHRWTILAHPTEHWSVRTSQIRRTTPALLGLFSLVTLFVHRRMRQAAGPFRGLACWYHKAHPTFADALALVRKELVDPGGADVLRVACAQRHVKSPAGVHGTTDL